MPKKSAEVAAEFARVREHEPKWYAAVLLSLTTGLRWSEVSGLKFADLDETNGVIRVVRALSRRGFHDQERSVRG